MTSSPTFSSHLKVRSAKSAIVAMFLSLFISLPVAMVNAPMANALTYGTAVDGLSCDTDLGYSNVSVTPTHGRAFYVDGTDKVAANDIDSGYVGYIIGTSSTSYPDLWVKIGSFVNPAGTVGLVPTSADQTSFKISTTTSPLSTSDSKTAFFSIKATNVNGWGTSTSLSGNFEHAVQVYSGNPAVAGSTLLRQCKYTFTLIKNSITAGTTNVLSNTVSNSNPALGETITNTLVMTTGTIGAGEAPDNSVIWISANPFSNFPVNALRLESTKITVSGAPAGCTTPLVYEDTLLVKNAGSPSCTNASNLTIDFIYKVIGGAGSSVRLAPVTQIASGTQIKHTDITTAALTVNLAGAISATAARLTFDKVETHTVGSAVETVTGESTFGRAAGTTYWKLYYVETVTSNSTSPTSLDFLVDSPTAGSRMDTSTAMISIDSGATWSSTIPSLIDSKYYFNGPFSITSTAGIVIKYTMFAPVMLLPEADTTTVVNTFSGLLGTSVIGSTVNTAKISNPTGEFKSNSVVTPPPPAFVRTDPATNIETSTATLNGFLSDTVTASGFFRYSTILESITANTSETFTAVVTTSSSKTYALSGLQPHTKYYFQAYQYNPGSTLLSGGVEEFITDGAGAITDPATSITQTSGQLNGSLTLNNETYTIYFTFSTNENLTSDTQTITIGDRRTDGPVNYVKSGLTAGTTYYYQVCAANEFETPCGVIRSFTTTSATPPASTPTLITPQITWPTPNLIAYPTPLSNLQLNSVAKYNGLEVPGTYVYQYPTGTVLKPGSYPMAVTFFPTNSSVYSPVTTSVVIVVVAPEVKITWPNPAPMQGPATLSPTQLNALCSVPGTLTYDPALGTVLAAGTYTLKVTCTPTDPNLPPVSTTVPLIVVEKLPTLTWQTPAKVAGPATLSPTQLNAVCSVPGTLVYDPALGTVLQEGTYTLKVTCVPTDPKLPSITTTVKLEVTEAVKPVLNPMTGPNTFTQGYINWTASPNATSYVVDIRGKTVCTTTTTTCTVKATIGPKTPVTVTAIGKLGDKAPAKAVYSNDKLLTAIVVNFATNSFALDAKAQREIVRVTTIVRREGFTFVEITGHTDPRGGALNVALSSNRSKALRLAMLKLAPGLSFNIAGFSYNEPVASNDSSAGMASNRRSEGAVR